MSVKSEAVKRWRKACKKRIITAMGGGCCICGYNKCQSSLALHHLDPNKKDFGLGAIRANPTNWDTIVKELRKCILVCHNCHGEIHEGISNIPANVPTFNDKYLKYREIDKYDNCSICHDVKNNKLKYCSQLCAKKASEKVNWDSINLAEEIKNKSVVKIAKELGCSNAAVHKRLKKLNIK